MKNTNAKPKRKAMPANRAKRPASTRPRSRAITAAQARRIAARFHAAQRFTGARVELEAAPAGGTSGDWRDGVWLVFPNPDNRSVFLIGPTEVIAVNRRTGRVVSAGYMSDEG